MFVVVGGSRFWDYIIEPAVVVAGLAPAPGRFLSLAWRRIY